MPCFHPLTGYVVRPEYRTDGKRLSFTYNPRRCYGPEVPSVSVPCGQCIGCKLERSRQWAIRAIHENQLHDTSCFLTLTYADEYLPTGQTLVKRDMQLFLKRLRKARGSFRLLYCGEYGETNFRPHYHAIIFGLDFRHDQRPLRRSPSGEMLFQSPSLDKLWGLGAVAIGSVTFESAAYVARYVTKKITGPAAEAHYAGRLPEFFQPSLKPGIGADWLARFRSDVYPSDQIVIRDGQVCGPPRYYDKLQDAFLGAEKSADFLQRTAFEQHQVKRQVKAKKHKSDNTPERLAVREEVTHARLKQLKRSL